ncbi:MAG: LysM domain-containing protein [Anaerolineae bacterium]|nr:LysM domain-containing protein [Anaerolineae bacterium]
MKFNKFTLPMLPALIIAVLFLTACERSASTPPVPQGTAQGTVLATATFHPAALTLTSPDAQATGKAVEGTAAPAAETATPEVQKTSDKSSPYMGEHTVRNGETLYSIGRAYGVSPMAIAEANNIAAPYTIYPGETFKIPRVRWPGGVPPGPIAQTQFSPEF